MQRRFRESVSFLTRAAAQTPVGAWMLYDCLIAALCIDLAYVLSPSAGKLLPTWPERIMFMAAALVCGLSTGVYDRQPPRGRWGLTTLFLRNTVLAGLVLGFVSRIVLFGQSGRWILVIATGLLFVFELVPRYLLFHTLRKNPLRVLFVGESGLSRTLIRTIRRRHNYQFVGCCLDGHEGKKHRVGDISAIPTICGQEKVDVVVLCANYVDHSQVLPYCFEALRHGCQLFDEVTFFEDVLQQVPVDHIDDAWFFSSRINMGRRFSLLVKRSLDIAFALVGLLVFLALLPLLALLVRVSSPGPIIYRQTRCGQFGRLFQIYKLRTMVVDAEAKGHQWAKRNDQRVTWVGRFLRITRLDELPQFYNILRGDMSLVGPRPERPEMVPEIERRVPYFSYRLWARPGLTGLAQVRYRYGASIEDSKQKLQYDLYYIKNWSLFLDLQIAMRTVMSVMRGSR